MIDDNLACQPFVRAVFRVLAAGDEWAPALMAAQDCLLKVPAAAARKYAPRSDMLRIERAEIDNYLAALRDIAIDFVEAFNAYVADENNNPSFAHKPDEVLIGAAGAVTAAELRVARVRDFGFDGDGSARRPGRPGRAPRPVNPEPPRCPAA